MMSLVIHCIPVVQLPSHSLALLCTASRVPAIGRLMPFLFISERTHSSFRGHSQVDLPLTASRMIIDLSSPPATPPPPWIPYFVFTVILLLVHTANKNGLYQPSPLQQQPVQSVAVNYKYFTCLR